MTPWLTCLLCSDDFTDLVAVQEHGMEVHAITRDDLRLATREGPTRCTVDTHTGWGDLAWDTYTWSLPDGRPWLIARLQPAEVRPARQPDPITSLDQTSPKFP